MYFYVMASVPDLEAAKDELVAKFGPIGTFETGVAEHVIFCLDSPCDIEDVREVVWPILGRKGRQIEVPVWGVPEGPGYFSEMKVVKIELGGESETVVIERQSPDHCWFTRPLKRRKVVCRFLYGEEHELDMLRVEDLGGKWQFAVAQKAHGLKSKCVPIRWAYRQAE